MVGRQALKQSARVVRPADKSRGSTWVAALRTESARYQRAVAAARTGGQGDIHELRIDTRRMLALLGLAAAFKPSRKWLGLVRELRRPFRKCARLRDLQATRVQLRQIQGRSRVPQHMLEELNEAVRRHRRRTTNYLTTVRPRKTCRKIIRLAQRRIAAPQMGDAVNQCLDRNQRAARAACRRMKTGDMKALHRARVAIKVYRYQLELAGSLAAVSRPVELRKLRRLQTELGAVTDLELLRRELKRYAHRHRRHRRTLAVAQRNLERERGRRFERALATVGRDAIVAK